TLHSSARSSPPFSPRLGLVTSTPCLLCSTPTFSSASTAVGVPPRARPPVIGAQAVARQLLERAPTFARFARAALVNGAAGLVVAPGARPIAVVAFPVVGG